MQLQHANHRCCWCVIDELSIVVLQRRYGQTFIFCRCKGTYCFGTEPRKKHIIIILFMPINLIVVEWWLKLLLFGLWQQEAAGCDPLDELYDALAEVVGAEDTTECYKSYMLVPTLLHTLIIHCDTACSSARFHLLWSTSLLDPSEHPWFSSGSKMLQRQFKD